MKAPLLACEAVRILHAGGLGHTECKGAPYLRTLYDYTYWARDKLLSAMQGITEADYCGENGFTYGSLRGILIHCLDGEYGWRCRLQDESTGGMLTAQDLPTVASLVERWGTEEAKMRSYLSRLTDEDLARDVIWHAPDGRERRLPDQ